MNWATQKAEAFPEAVAAKNKCEFDYGDFNGPLSEQQVGTMIQSCTHSELVMDQLDVEEAERRLADPNDKVIPFKPAR